MTGSGVELAVTALLSGGLASALSTLVTSRAMAGKTAVEAKGLEAKLPAEVDSVVVQGAEAAVLTMKAALDSATGRIAQLEAERATDRDKILALEAKVARLEGKVNAAERALGSARREGAALREELTQFLAEQAKRR